MYTNAMRALMTKSTVVTTRLAPAATEGLDTLAKELDRSRAWIVAKAVERYVADELEFIAFIKEGEADLDAGRTISHEELVREIVERRAKRKAA
jgi:predicted transcriptional regulator